MFKINFKKYQGKIKIFYFAGVYAEECIKICNDFTEASIWWYEFLYNERNDLSIYAVYDKNDSLIFHADRWSEKENTAEDAENQAFLNMMALNYADTKTNFKEKNDILKDVKYLKEDF